MMLGAIDGGGTKVLTAVMTDAGKIVSRRQDCVPTQDYAGYYARCAEMLRECAVEAGVRLTDLAGVGVSVPAMTEVVPV